MRSIRQIKIRRVKSRASRPTVELQRDVAGIKHGIVCLKEARDVMRQSGAVRAAEYIARALKSAEGAERHAHNLAANAELGIGAHRTAGHG